MAEILVQTLHTSLENGSAGDTFSNLLIGAINGNGNHTLEDIRAAVEATSLYEEIDVLTVVPLLLRYSGHGGVDILNDIGCKCSSKEIVISVQEVLGRLLVSLLSEESDRIGEEENDDEAEVPIDLQLVRIMDMYSLALARLPKRRKPPNEILRPIIDQLTSVVRVAGPLSGTQRGKDFVTSASRITASLTAWAAEDLREQPKCASILFDFICSTLEACSKKIQINIAQNAFEAQFPRFIRGASSSSSSTSPVDVVQYALSALALFGITPPYFLNHPSIGSVVLLAHAQPPYPLGSELFPLLRWFLLSIQMNIALDETLALLLTSMGSIKAIGTPDVPLQFIIPLVHILAPLAGSHPDAPTRHIVFRLLSITLSLAAPADRFDLLRELLSDAEGLTPHMQVAAIGLVREAVVEALSTPDRSQPNPFASPIILRDIGPLVFGLQSPDMYTECGVSLSDFMESSEPLRLVESLTLLYLLLQRDTNNKTEIHNSEQIKTIARRFLIPLRCQIDFWMQGDESNETHDDHEEHDHSMLQLGIIDMWLSRTHSAANEVL